MIGAVAERVCHPPAGGSRRQTRNARLRAADSHANRLAFSKMILIVFVIFFLIAGTTVESVTIDPINPVVRAEETVRLMCRTNGSPIKKCQWEINGDLYELGEGQRFQPFGRLQDGECGIQVGTLPLNVALLVVNSVARLYCCLLGGAVPYNKIQLGYMLPL